MFKAHGPGWVLPGGASPFAGRIPAIKHVLAFEFRASVTIIARSRLKPAKMRTAGSMMRAEASVLSVHHQLAECRTRQVDEGGMVTAFKVNIALLSDAVVNNGLNPICFTNGWHSAELAVGEEPRDFVFRSQRKGIIEALSKRFPFQLSRRRQHYEKIASVSFKYDGFCQCVSRDVRCLNGA